MQTVPIELPDKLAMLLDSVCLENNKLKQEVVKELVIRYLEDIEDAADAMRAIEEGGEPVSLEKLRQELAWSIEFEAAARKQIKKLPRQAQAGILRYLEQKIAPLDNPRLRGEALKANLSGLWRYRVENYRIICRIMDERLVVLVVKVGHRREIYD